MTDFPKIIYIAGTGRNGSTLIGNTLGEFPDVVSVGELRYLWRDLYFGRLCGCGTEIGLCKFWGQVVKKAFGSLNKSEIRFLMVATEDLTRRSGLFSLNILREKAKIAELINSFEVIYKAVQSVSKRSLIVDSSKTPILEKLLFSRLSFPVYTIHLIRDPRATSYSWTTMKNSPDPNEPFLLKSGIFAAAFSWATWNVAIEIPRNKNYLRMLYEDWSENPQSGLEKIMQFVGVRQLSMSQLARREVEIGTHHTVSGNPVRFSKGIMSIKQDDRWKVSMSMYHKALVMALTWPLYLKYYHFRKSQ